MDDLTPPHWGAPLDEDDYPWFVPVEPHEYVPDPMTMGDCAVCGNVRDSAAHALPPPPEGETP